MKVLDNLENYNIPPQFRLTVEQEETLAKDLEQIVKDLIPIRGSKLKTRVYFNQHLRYTSNVNDYLALPDTPPDKYEFGESYKPLPGEYTWNSDLLQPALLDILKVDEYGFGYVVNLINRDIYERCNRKMPEPYTISDALTKFAQQFNVEDVREEAKKIESLPERILYLNKIYTDFQIFEGLSNDEENWIAVPIGESLEALKKEAETELQIQEKHSIKAPSKKLIGSKESEAATITLQPHTDYNIPLSYEGIVLSDIYYSPEVMGTGQFSEIDLHLDWEFATRQKPNTKVFTQRLIELFQHAFLDNEDPTINVASIKDVEVLISKLFEDYTNRISSIHEDDNRAIAKSIIDWVSNTIECIDKAYKKSPRLWLENEIDQNSGAQTPSSHSTMFLRQLLTEEVIWCLTHYGAMYYGSIDESLQHILPYNLWGEGYESQYAQLLGKVGLSKEDRAKVFLKANEEWMDGEIMSGFNLYDEEYQRELPFGGQDDIDYNPERELPQLFQKLFASYIQRIQNAGINAELSDRAFQSWIFSLVSRVHALLSAEKDDEVASAHYFEGIANTCLYYFVDCCFCPLVEMFKNYYSDSEEIAKQKPIAKKPQIKGNEQDHQKEQVAHERKDVFGAAICYSLDDTSAHDELLKMLLSLSESGASTLSPDTLKESFEIIDASFDRFALDCEVMEEDRIAVLFDCIDQWGTRFHELIDRVYSDFQRKTRPKTGRGPQKKIYEEQERKAHCAVMFFMERVNLIVSRQKAEILYNHRYFEQVYYNVHGWSYEQLVAGMEEYRDKHGLGIDKDVLFDRDINIESFYPVLLDIVKNGVLESYSESPDMDKDERTPMYKDGIRLLFEHDLPMYLEMVKLESTCSTEEYHEVVSWVETTRYCLLQIFQAVELHIAGNEDLMAELDLDYLQEINAELLQKHSEEAIDNYRSETAIPEVDDVLNNLGERDEDECDCEIPVFKTDMIGEDFITEEDFEKECMTLRELVEKDKEAFAKIGVEIAEPKPKIPSASESISALSGQSTRILLKDRTAEVQSYIKSLIKTDAPTDAVALLLAAKEVGLTANLTFNDATTLFGDFAKRSTFNTYYNKKREVNPSTLSAYKEALKKAFPVAESGSE